MGKTNSKTKEGGSGESPIVTWGSWGIFKKKVDPLNGLKADPPLKKSVTKTQNWSNAAKAAWEKRRGPGVVPVAIDGQGSSMALDSEESTPKVTTHNSFLVSTNSFKGIHQE